MQSRHESILRLVNRKDRPLNVLTFPTHERYQSNLGHLKHNFYLWRAEGIKHWKNEYAQLPANHIMLDGTKDQIKPDMRFDLVLSQNKYGQYEAARQFSDYLGIPLISLEHTLPMTWWPDKYVAKTAKMRGHINLFISKYSITKWKFNESDPDVDVMYHAIDSETFKPKDGGHNDGKVLTVMNDAINRGPLLGWDIYERLIEGLVANPVGDTPGFSKAANGLDDLVGHYQNASVFLNTSQVSPIPMSVLEAMSCACPVVSTATCMLPEVIKDGENGFISNDLDYLRNKLEYCLENPDKVIEMGQNARKTIQQMFSLEQHLSKWNEVFNKAVNKGYYAL